MYEQERANIEYISDKYSHIRVIPEFSAPVARLIERCCATLKISPPLVIRKFQHRAEAKGPNGVSEKISLDFYGRGYADLTPAQQAEVHSLDSSLAFHDPANGHPYTKPGFNFAQARHLLIETYRTEVSERYPQEIRTALADFRTGLEKDLDEAAKSHGFYQEYSHANQALRIATAGPHRINQSIPIVTARR